MVPENPAIFQAESLDEFLKIAFDVKHVARAQNLPYFQVGSSGKCLSYGAKILVAGNDASFNSFVQEYVRSMLALKDVENADLKKNTQVFLLPSGFNSISAFIAAREPLYRQNVF